MELSSVEQPPNKRSRQSSEDIASTSESTVPPFSTSNATMEKNGLELLQIFNSMVGGSRSPSSSKHTSKNLSSKKGVNTENSRAKFQVPTVDKTVISSKDIVGMKKKTIEKTLFKSEFRQNNGENLELPAKIAPIFTHPLLTPEQAVDSLYHLNRAQIIQFSIHAFDALCGVLEEKLERQRYLEKRRLDLAHILIRLGLVKDYDHDQDEA